jgi:hypothetical protein
VISKSRIGRTTQSLRSWCNRGLPAGRSAALAATRIGRTRYKTTFDNDDYRRSTALVIGDAEIK